MFLFGSGPCVINHGTIAVPAGLLHLHGFPSRRKIREVLDYRWVQAGRIRSGVFGTRAASVGKPFCENVFQFRRYGFIGWFFFCILSFECFCFCSGTAADFDLPLAFASLSRVSTAINSPISGHCDLPVWKMMTQVYFILAEGQNFCLNDLPFALLQVFFYNCFICFRFFLCR